MFIIKLVNSHQVLTAKLVTGGGWGGVCRVARPDPYQVASEQGR